MTDEAARKAQEMEREKLEALLRTVPDEHRWKFRIVEPGPVNDWYAASTTCASYSAPPPMPYIENWADPRPVVHVSRSRTTASTAPIRSSASSDDYGFGAGVLGAAIGGAIGGGFTGGGGSFGGGGASGSW